VYPVRIQARRLPFRAELFATGPDAWNEDQPYSTAERPVPRFQPPAPEDPDNNTAEARRRGSFPVGVAFEAEVPPAWSGGGEGPAKRVRGVAGPVRLPRPGGAAGPAAALAPHRRRPIPGRAGAG